MEMGTSGVRFIGAGLGFLLILVSGYWLSHIGKPYNAILFNIHKLVAVAAIVLLVIIVVRANRVAALSTIELIAAVATGVSFLSLVASGGVLSIVKEMPAVVLKVHQVAPYLTVVLTGATLYLLRGR